MPNPTHNQGADPMLTKLGVAKALRSMAAITQGIHDPDAALLWAVKQGFLVGQGSPGPDGTPGLVLTRKGAAAVWLFWRAWERAARAHRGENVDTSDFDRIDLDADGEAVID